MTGPLGAVPSLPLAVPPLQPSVLLPSDGHGEGMLSAQQQAQPLPAAQLAGLLEALSAPGTLSAPTLSVPSLMGSEEARGGTTTAAGGAGATSAPVAAGGRGRNARGNNEPRASGSYSARHQQAEARRRSRINERLEALRRLVPHTERANTANFLEEVVGYVQRLQQRVSELERQAGLPSTVQQPCGKPAAFADDTAAEQVLPAASQPQERHAAQSQPPPLPLPLPIPAVPLPQQPAPAPSPAPDATAAQAAALLPLLLQQVAQQQAQQQVAQQLQQQLQQQAQQAQAQQLVQALLAQAQQQVQQQAAPPAAPLFPFQQQPLPQPQQASTSLLNMPMPQQPPVSWQQSAPASMPRPPSTTGRQSQGACPPSVDPQTLAAADSMCALSAGGGGGSMQSLDDARLASRANGVAGSPGQQQGKGSAVKVEAQGIPTDEELDMLHMELSAHQDGKRRKLAAA